MEDGIRDGMDLVLPFWNFIVGVETGVLLRALEIPPMEIDKYFYLFVY